MGAEWARKCNRKTPLVGPTDSYSRVADTADIVAVVESRDHRENVLRLVDVLANEAHHHFTKGQWRTVRFLNHPEVKLTMSMNASDYQAFIRSCPIVRNRAEKDAVRWCHLTHQVIAGASVHSREHKPQTAAFHGRSGALTRFALRHHQDTP